jgi:hypothetical protein
MWLNQFMKTIYFWFSFRRLLQLKSKFWLDIDACAVCTSLTTTAPFHHQFQDTNLCYLCGTATCNPPCRPLKFPPIASITQPASEVRVLLFAPVFCFLCTTSYKLFRFLFPSADLVSSPASAWPFSAERHDAELCSGSSRRTNMAYLIASEAHTEVRAARINTASVTNGLRRFNCQGC